MASSAKDPRAARSGAALRQAMLRLLEEKTFDQITIREVCAQAGIHYATFFRHHPSKEALLDAIAADQIAQLVDLTLPVQETAGHGTAIEGLFEYVERHRTLWSTLLNGGAGKVMRDEWLRRARIVTESYVGAPSWLPQQLGVIASVTLIIETVTWWLRQPQGEYSADVIAQILSRLLSAIVSPDEVASEASRQR